MKTRGLFISSMVAAALAFTPSGTATAAPAPSLTSSSAPINVMPYGWTKVDAHPDGVPKKQCGPANDGEMVETEDIEGGRRLWICRHINPIFKEPYWEWSETVLA